MNDKLMEVRDEGWYRGSSFFFKSTLKELNDFEENKNDPNNHISSVIVLQAPFQVLPNRQFYYYTIRICLGVLLIKYIFHTKLSSSNNHIGYRFVIRYQ